MPAGETRQCPGAETRGMGGQNRAQVFRVFCHVILTTPILISILNVQRLSLREIT